MTSRIAGAAVAALLLVVASEARADIIFSLDQGSLQPTENLLFADGGSGTSVQGHTNTTNTLFTIRSNENLTASGGQATVSASDGSFNLFFLEPTDPAILFSEFEADVRVVAHSSGTATVTACTQGGNFDGAGFTPVGANMIGDGKPCEQFSYTLGAGENFFVLSVAGSQLLTGVTISTNVGIADVRQIRLSPDSADGSVTNTAAVPEPASLVLLGSGLLAGARTLRRRKTAPQV